MFVNLEDKTIRPQDMQQFLFILGDFEQNQMVTVTIEPLIRERSLSQNGLFYKYVTLIAEFTGATKEEVKLHVKKNYGVRNEFGGLKSTRDYSTVEMNRLIEGTRLFGIEECHMENLPDPEEWKNKNLKSQ